MINKRVLIFLAVFFAAGAQVCCAELPVCSNRIVNNVMTRVGCAVGDTRCWLSKGGYCTDYVQKMTGHGQPGDADRWNRINPGDVKKGDVALFISFMHFAYVEGVVNDKEGRPVAVNLSEYNYGACWVDQANMVTDKYKTVNKRPGIPLGKVDGGFWRPR